MKKIQQQLEQQGIELIITRKKVKNINFRIKPYCLSVSAPWYATDLDIALALSKRLQWALHNHQKILNKQKYRIDDEHNSKAKLFVDKRLVLWGQQREDVLTLEQRLKLYRAELTACMPELFTKWQPVVGKVAAETRIKKMKTRWGSCNTKAKRIWLSVYLPEYPIQCTEYVIVHELCHLHHANHSKKFWQKVATAMPDYKHWHDMLAKGYDVAKLPDS